MKKDIYNVGIYCRLSNDDERNGESVSIENQKLLLQKYVQEHGWNEVDTYIDDGYSGTNFNRPAVQKLIKDAKSKRINVILVKDLSRFGRNYIEIGQYTDYLFPAIGCRFIALNNGIDTFSENGNNDIMCFLNIFNEFYSRDTSRKVKSVKKACAESGKFMGTYPAYGYKRDPSDKYHLIIDEETAPIVYQIFSMRATGMSFNSIAQKLNNNNILSPGSLYYKRNNKKDPRNVTHKWTESTVKNIIRNEVYIGNMVQGKSGTLSYKSRKLINKPKNEWIRAQNTHKAIISAELWNSVLKIDMKKVRKSPTSDGIKSIFTGLVYCADCGLKMRNHIEKFKYKDGSNGRYSSFICSNYSRNGKDVCSIHLIYENVLYCIILQTLKESNNFECYDTKRLLDKIISLKNKKSNSKFTVFEQEIKKYKSRIYELETLIEKLYEDKCNGIISDKIFQTLINKYEMEYDEKNISLSNLQTSLTINSNSQYNNDYIEKTIKFYTELSDLDEYIVLELIDRIEVGQTVIIDDEKFCDIKIYYTYKNKSKNL